MIHLVLADKAEGSAHHDAHFAPRLATRPSGRIWPITFGKRGPRLQDVVREPEENCVSLQGDVGFLCRRSNQFDIVPACFETLRLAS